MITLYIKNLATAAIFNNLFTLITQEAFHNRERVYIISSFNFVYSAAGTPRPSVEKIGIKIYFYQHLLNLR